MHTRGVSQRSVCQMSNSFCTLLQLTHNIGFTTVRVQVMILSQDKDRGRMSLSTKKLEPTPGDMLRDPQKVYERADEMAKAFQERLAQAEATARAEGVQF